MLIYLRAVFLINVITKTVKDANIDDNEEYLKTNATTIHVKINNKLNWIDNANKIPKYVATPFPPLNFSHTGKICPKNTTRQDKLINSGKYFIVMITGKYPFNISKAKVKIASTLFPVRKTFVAPIFPEPIFLTSFPWKVFVKIKPKGTDPLRYDNVKTIRISI